MGRRRNLCAIAALALALAGCGGGGGGGGSAGSDQISLAAAKTSKAGSIKADFTVNGGGVQGRCLEATVLEDVAPELDFWQELRSVERHGA